MRVLVAWCASWPVTALGHGEDELVAVLEANRVIATSPAAHALGVNAGQLRRTAEHHCPGLVVQKRDRALEARTFEPVLGAISELVPLVEVTRPGLCAFEVRGPARYFGGEEALRARVGEVIRQVLPEQGRFSLHLGIADGRFAAGLAARRNCIVATKKTASFLSSWPVSMLNEPDLVDLLVRLGIGTLGAFAALPEDSVRTRFGRIGELAHRRARGLDDEPIRPESLHEEIVAVSEFDPPTVRVDVAAFAARAMANELHQRLGEAVLACVRLRIEAETEHGETLSRLWRSEGSFTPEAIVERLRWQLDGWLAGTTPEPAPTAGITLLRVVADEVIKDSGSQLNFFGGRSDTDQRASRGLDRLIGLLGPQAVFTGVLQGGRGPGERMALVPWGEPRPRFRATEPWPGHHPLPAPALVHRELLAAQVLGHDDEPVRVLVRGVLPSTPRRISVEGGPWREIIKWSGPWLIDERSWDKSARRRRSRFQLLTENQVGYLCLVESNRWWIEATYD